MREDRGGSPFGLILGLIITVVVLGGAGWWAWQWDYVDPGNAGILLNFCDGSQTVITDSKRRWISPQCERLAEYPTAEFTLTMLRAGPDQIGEAIPCPMRDQQVMLIDSSTAWAVDPARVADIYRMRPGVLLNTGKGDDIAALVVRPEIRAGVRDACTRYTWEEAYGPKRTEFESTAEKAVQERLDPVGIKVRTVSIRDMDPNPELDKLIAARLEGQRQTEATAYQARQAENEGQRQLAQQKAASAVQIQQGQDAYALQQAQARAAAELQRINSEASLIKSENDAKQAEVASRAAAARVETEARAEATRIREVGEAEGAANKARSSSITTQMVELERAKRWDGRMPQAGTVINTNGPVAVPFTGSQP